MSEKVVLAKLLDLLLKPQGSKGSATIDTTKNANELVDTLQTAALLLGRGVLPKDQVVDDLISGTSLAMVGLADMLDTTFLYISWNADMFTDNVPKVLLIGADTETAGLLASVGADVRDNLGPHPDDDADDDDDESEEEEEVDNAQDIEYDVN